MTKEIPLTQGKVAIVDDGDYELLNRFSWRVLKGRHTWYAVRSVGKWPHQKAILMHREILGAPKGIKGDHKDGNGLHNWRDNLRQATEAQNQANRGRDIDNTTGWKGIHWCASKGKWRARIGVNNHIVSLGYYPSANDAAHAYDDAALQYFGEFAQLNFK